MIGEPRAFKQHSQHVEHDLATDKGTTTVGECVVAVLGCCAALEQELCLQFESSLALGCLILFLSAKYIVSL